MNFRWTFTFKTVLSSLLFLLTFCAASALAQPWNGRHFPLESDPQDPPQESPEQHYAIFRKIDSTWHPGRYDLYQVADRSKKGRAILWINNNCKALIEQQAFFDKEKKLSFAAAQAQFGEPRRFGHVAVFDLVGDYWKEPNIFHLDITFDDNDIAQKYLVRGIGIVADQDFHDIDAQQKGKHDFAVTAKPKISSKVFVVDKTANTIGAGYEQIMPFSEEIAAVKQDGLWGYIDTAGKVLLKPTYSDAQSFSEGMAAVKLGAKAGFVGRDGTLLIPCKFLYASAFSDGLALVRFGGLWGYINKKGSFVIPPKYDYAESFSNGLAVVELNHMQGYIDKTGKTVGELKFLRAYSFKNGFGAAAPKDRLPP